MHLNKDNNSPLSHLSPHPAGSIRELWHISFPLMLTTLSGSLMLFCDRLILARYSIDAMNAVTLAGSVCAIFQFGTIAIVSIAEVFVGQYNGAKHFKLLGEPVWQMIWFCVMTLLLFLPLGFLAGPLFLPQKYHALGIPYFQWIMIFGPILPMISALAAFFIGQGKVNLVTFNAVFANLLNLLLGVIFVFGIPKFGIPSLGTLGIAIATITAQIIQLVILFVVFLAPRHRTQHGTTHYKLKLDTFTKCIRIGLPNSISHMIEITGWASLIYMLSLVSETHVTLLSIGQSVLLLFAFASEGLQKGVLAIASNFIGANEPQMIKKLFHASLQLIFYIILFLALPLLLMPNWIINSFTSTSISSVELNELQELAKVVLFWIWIYFIFDIIVWVLAAILTAAGDTRFIMIVNALNIWLFAIFPIYFFVVKMNGAPILNWQLIQLYVLANLICFFYRYQSNKWNSFLLDDIKTNIRP